MLISIFLSVYLCGRGGLFYNEDDVLLLLLLLNHLSLFVGVYAGFPLLRQSLKQAWVQFRVEGKERGVVEHTGVTLSREDITSMNKRHINNNAMTPATIVDAVVGKEVTVERKAEEMEELHKMLREEKRQKKEIEKGKN